MIYGLFITSRKIIEKSLVRDIIDEMTNIKSILRDF